MKRLRVSASDLDAFRRFKASEDIPLTDLLAQLRRELPPTPAMLAGTALHKALELVEAGEFEALEANDHRFMFADEVEISLPDIREMKVTAERQIGDVLVTLVGMVDAVQGRSVTDHKFTGRFDPERFLNSYQWRVYLDLFDADRFEWIVYEAKEVDDRAFLVTDVHRLTAHRYPGMSDDLNRELSAFVDFAKVHLMDEAAQQAVEGVA